MITKEKFESYRRVQSSGLYNMVMQANYAMEDAGLTKNEYWDIIKHYGEYYNKYVNN